MTFPSSSRAFSEFKKDHVDLTCAASYAFNRRGFAECSRTYRTEIMQVFSHISQPPLQKSPNGRLPLALNNAIVAINRGSVYGPAFSHFQAQCTDCVIELSESIDRFELIKHKRVNFAVEDLLSGAYLIKITRSLVTAFVQLTSRFTATLCTTCCAQACSTRKSYVNLT